jgi:hypothetical protein
MTSQDKVDALCGATKTVTCPVADAPVPPSLLWLGDGPGSLAESASLLNIDANNDIIHVHHVPSVVRVPAEMVALPYFTDLRGDASSDNTAKKFAILVVGSNVGDQYRGHDLAHLPSGQFPVYQQSRPQFQQSSMTKIRSMRDAANLNTFVERIKKNCRYVNRPIRIDHVFVTKLAPGEKLHSQSSDPTQLAPHSPVILVFLGGRFEVQFRRKDDTGGGGSGSRDCVLTVPVGSSSMIVVGPETTATMEYSIAAQAASAADGGTASNMFVLTMRQVDVDSLMTRNALQKTIDSNKTKCRTRQVSSQKKRIAMAASECEQPANSAPVSSASMTIEKKLKKHHNSAVDDKADDEDVDE